MRWQLLFAVALLAAPALTAAPEAQRIGENLYAYVSDNDGSANATFLVTSEGIVVVDSGLNQVEAGKLLGAIRAVSGAPIRYIINTHYHPDHQGGNAALDGNATIISTEWTRNRTLEFMQSPAGSQFHFKPATQTFQGAMMLYLGSDTVEIYFPGPAHTSGDALVFFPRQRAAAMGDLFMNGSCPAMDAGSVSNWIAALDRVLARELVVFVPGHFAVGARKDLVFFRDYLQELYSQVQHMVAEGRDLAAVKSGIHMDKFKSLRQYPQYHATFEGNAQSIYEQLRAQ